MSPIAGAPQDAQGSGPEVDARQCAPLRGQVAGGRQPDHAPWPGVRGIAALGVAHASAQWVRQPPP